MSNLVLLATEAGAESGGGGMSGGTIAVIILIAALAAFAAAYFVVGPGRRRGPRVRGDIPLAMRPYHSDEELETTGMERAMAWGVALSVFAAVFVPLYWVVEPARINAKRDDFFMQDVEFGRAQFAQACVSCHGENAQGGFAPHPDPDIDAPWPAPQLNNIMARYQDSEIVTDVREFMIQTVKQGRNGTPMPAWGTAYNGPMNDQQVESIVDYILSIQTGELPEAEAFVGASGDEVFQANCARCHGQNAEGRVGPSLQNVFERFGASAEDPASQEQARAAVRYTLEVGRMVPNAAPMPSWSGVISEEAIDKVVDYLASIQTTGGPAFGQLGGIPTPSATESAGEGS